MPKHPCMRRKSRLRLWWLNHFGKRSTSLYEGRPRGETSHYMVVVYYGGYWCEQSVHGPFDFRTAQALWQREFDRGHGALVYYCTNVTDIALSYREATAADCP